MLYCLFHSQSVCHDSKDMQFACLLSVLPPVHILSKQITTSTSTYLLYIYSPNRSQHLPVHTACTYTLQTDHTTSTSTYLLYIYSPNRSQHLPVHTTCTYTLQTDHNIYQYIPPVSKHVLQFLHCHIFCSKNKLP